MIYLHRVRASREMPSEPAYLEMQRLPVEIRGNITFGRLMSGLSSVGLTVHVDAQSGRIVITDGLAV